ncbi:MAG: FxLYD domain-containing protein [Deltaproteobacteria bacterium]|nr:FxLYD domain-containing protein [Deltaproteobacteria bacterium]
MSTEPIRCPACGAGDPSPANAAGVHTCVYCGTRYRLKGGVGHVLPAAGSAGPVRGAAVAALLLIVFVGALAGYLVVSPAPEPLAPPRTPTPPTAPTPLEAPASNPATTLVPSPRPAAAPAVAATAEFVEHHRKDSGGALWIYGMVTNTSPFLVDKVEVIGVLKDADGAELGTKNGFAKREVLAPGDSSPVVILVKDTPEFASISWELDVDKARWVPDLASDLRVEASTPTQNDWGGWQAEGKVHNEGDTPVKHVHVELQGWSADDKLIGIGDAYAKGDTLAPGESARFKHASVQFDQEPARFEMHVEGRVAE